METGRHRALGAAVFALAALCHVIPAIFAATGAVVWWIVSLVRRSGIGQRLWWLVGVGGVGGALCAWWFLPFYLRSPYMNDMGWEKRTTYIDLLFRREQLDSGLVDAPRIEWVLVLALLGVIMSVAWKRRTGGFLVVLGAVMAVAFVLVPQGRLWNARLLPFWYLCLYLLAAIGIAELGRTVATLLARDPNRPVRLVTSATAVVGSLVVIVALAMPLRAMPGGEVAADGSYRWLFLSTRDTSFVSSWARWNFSGYEEKPAYPEYHDVVTTMAELGDTNGCGRAMWEHEEQHDRYGTPMALMLLPFWTDGCIGSMEGLFFESSSTTPYHFLMQDELSSAPSNAQRDLPYSPGPPTEEEFGIGVQHMQMLGVQYYMAISERMQEMAGSEPALTEVAASGPWRIYEVADSDLVVPLDARPAVLTGVDPAHGWLDAVVPWYEDPSRWAVPLAADGPADWERVTEGETPNVEPTSPVAVTSVETDTDRISFEVSQTGTPVLVKTSYFPNWTASGADGPWRISPNLMVVVPTNNEVTLEFSSTPVEWVSWAITALGAVGLVLLWRASPLTMPPPRRWLGPRSDGPSPDDAPHEPPSAPARSSSGTPAAEFDPVTTILGTIGMPTTAATEPDEGAAVDPDAETDAETDVDVDVETDVETDVALDTGIEPGAGPPSEANGPEPPS